MSHLWLGFVPQVAPAVGWPTTRASNLGQLPEVGICGESRHGVLKPSRHKLLHPAPHLPLRRKASQTKRLNALYAMAPRNNGQSTAAELSIVHLKNSLVNLPATLVSLLVNVNTVRTMSHACFRLVASSVLYTHIL